MTYVKTLTAACAALVFSAGASAMSVGFNNSTNETSWLNAKSSSSQNRSAPMEGGVSARAGVNNTTNETNWLNPAAASSSRSSLDSTSSTSSASSATRSMGAGPAAGTRSDKATVESTIRIPAAV